MDNVNEKKVTHISKELNRYSYFNLLTIVLKNVQLSAPYPEELAYEQLFVSDNVKSFEEDFVIKDNEGIYCRNEEVTKRQNGIFADVAKQVGKGLFNSGSSVISISLPIRIFEPRSMLERYIDWWSYAPVYLKKAGSTNNKIEAFKHCICFVISALYLSSNQMKPFNPYLGETFQAKFDDGTEIYLEHTSHVPCVSNYLIKDKDQLYTMFGYCDMQVEGFIKMLLTNFITMAQKGKNNIYLKTTGQTISFQYPKCIINGMIYGGRHVLFDGHMKFEDKQNNIKAVIVFNKHHEKLKLRRVHDFYGQVYHYDFKKNPQKDFYEEKYDSKKTFPSDKKMVYSEVCGSWLENVIFDNEIYASINDPSIKRPKLIPEPVPIYSDSRYREDLIWLKRGDIYKIDEFSEYAQSWKIALEVQQRHDRALREKNSKKK